MKRYRMEGGLGHNEGHVTVTECEAGEWVRYEDAIAALEAERERCAQLCDAHAVEPQVMRAGSIEETPWESGALDCAALIRIRPRPWPTTPLTPDPEVIWTDRY